MLNLTPGDRCWNQATLGEDWEGGGGRGARDQGGGREEEEEGRGGPRPNYNLSAENCHKKICVKNANCIHRQKKVLNHLEQKIGRGKGEVQKWDGK